MITYNNCFQPARLSFFTSWKITVKSKGAGSQATILKDSMKLNWNFLKSWEGERSSKKFSASGVWMSSFRAVIKGYCP